MNLRSAFLALGFSGWSVSGASNRSAIHRCNSQHNIIIIIYIYVLLLLMYIIYIYILLITFPYGNTQKKHTIKTTSDATQMSLAA